MSQEGKKTTTAIVLTKCSENCSKLCDMLIKIREYFQGF